MTFDDVFEAYIAISKKYGLNAAFSCHTDLERHVFFRGRAPAPTELRPLENVFSYPPPQFCRSYGRANLPRQPVLYAAETPETIADELRLSDEAWLHIAVFYTPEPVVMKVMPFLHSGFTAENEWSELRDAFKTFVEEGGDARFGVKPVPLRFTRIEALAMAFRGDDYAETAILAHYWLNNPRPELKADAIVYPSVRRDDACNFAIASGFVDAHLRLFRVFLCRFAGGRFQVESTGEVSVGGSLWWREPNEDDRGHWYAGFAALGDGECDSIEG
ncbi:MAG: RES domain-containing protein [Bryobacteraceae bacterium]